VSIASRSGKPQVEPEDILAFMRGEMAGFQLVYAGYRQKVLAYCLYFMGDHSLAEDAFQEVFIRVYTRREQLREPNALTTWVLCIARSVCLNMLRTSKFKPEFVSIDERGTDHPSFGVLASGSVDYEIIDDQLLKALSQLPMIYRDALLLSEFEGYSYEEIAELTGTTAHNVNVRVTRAKQKLREILLPSDVPQKKTRKRTVQSLREAVTKRYLTSQELQNKLRTQ
jgi:RNA polymerase sigma-70 factor (ECF subfamily)